MKNRKYFILVYLIIISFYCKAQTIYVDANNTTGIENGSSANPFNTIKEGIAAADPGDTVFIRQGTYLPDEGWSGNDSILFLKAGVKLVGEGADKSIVDGSIVDASVSNLPICIEKIRFKAFSFARGTIAGPFAGQSIIRNCKAGLIAIMHGKGIPVNDTTPGPIYGFVIENNDLGEGSIEFKQGAGIAENRITGNTVGYIDLASGGGFTYFIDNNDIQFGIADRSGACKTTISNNRIYNGAIIDKSGGGGYGVEDEIIENNTITCSETSPLLVGEEEYAAAIIARGWAVTIRNNEITCTGHVSGINSASGSPFNVINNTIFIDEVFAVPPDVDNATWGIKNYSGYGVVTGNIIQGGYIGYYSKAGTTEFANNEIRKSYIGFSSVGREEVHHNTIEECYGDGMILIGLRGPLHQNTIRNNAGSGIRILRMPIDLGGGDDNCPGLNELTGNGNFDLFVETTSALYPVLFARYNVWDHTDTLEIMQYDIRDGSDSTGLLRVDFTPAGYLGTDNTVTGNRLKISPNPLFQFACITWKVSEKSVVSLKIFDNTGREIITLVNNQQYPGSYQTVLDASNLQAGVYFCQLLVNGIASTCKIIVCR